LSLGNNLFPAYFITSVARVVCYCQPGAKNCKKSEVFGIIRAGRLETILVMLPL